MIHISLYWSHICVLHRGEKQFLDRLAESLREEGIELEVRFFGLGYPEHMCEYLASPDAVLPDIIVSADLEVFEVPAIYEKIKSDLYPAADWIPLRRCAALDAVRRDESLLPFVSIALVYYTRQPETCASTALPDWEGLAFGGINNSAAKTVVKTVWNRWGRKAAERLLSKSTVTEMPIGAFQAVRTGQAKTALVPSLYALRADESETYLRAPLEGPLLIPSYFCARTTVPEAVARKVAERILCPELCGFYAEQGDLILHPDIIDFRSKQENHCYLVPEASWLSSLSADDFYRLYCRALPTAHLI